MFPPSNMPRPSHTFRLEKSTIWTNGDPRGWFISVYQHKGSDTAGTAEIRNKQHSSSGKSKNEELVYGTSMAHWYKQRLFLPPGFTFGRYGENDASHEDVKQANGKHQSNAVIWPLLRISYKGLEGAVNLNATIESTEASKGDSTNAKLNKPPGWKIHRESGRRYSVKDAAAVEKQASLQSAIGPITLEWRGTQRALNLLPEPASDEKSSHANGNLKLVAIPAHQNTSDTLTDTRTSDEDGRAETVLAVYSNQTDWKTLGALTVFEVAQELNVLSVEEIVSSCICIVAAERLTLRGWWGGMTKQTKGLPKQSSFPLNNNNQNNAEP